MQLKFKVWLEKDGEVIASNGKIGLLKLIGELGSIQKAAQEYGMSYRHAWGIIQKIEKRSGLKFVETQVGGRDGGRARLTPTGREFLGQYSTFQRGLAEMIEKKFKAAFK